MNKSFSLILVFLLLLFGAMPVMAAEQEAVQPNEPIWFWIGLLIMGVSALIILFLAWKQGGKGNE